MAAQIQRTTMAPGGTTVVRGIIVAGGTIIVQATILETKVIGILQIQLGGTIMAAGGTITKVPPITVETKVIGILRILPHGTITVAGGTMAVGGIIIITLEIQVI